MDVDHQVELVQRHVLEGLVAQDASVVDDDVDRSESCQGVVHDALGAVPVGDGRLVGNGLAASRLDLRHHRIGSVRLAFAVDGTAQVVHHHLGAALRERQRMAPAQAVASTRDDGHLAFEIAHFVHAP